MISRAAASLAGVLGGLCWLARYLLDRFGVVSASGDVGMVLLWLGATWLVLALVSGGVRLARAQAVALRLLLGVVAAVLGWVVLSLAYALLPDRLAEAVVGTVVAVASLVVYLRVRGRETEAPERVR